MSKKLTSAVEELALERAWGHFRKKPSCQEWDRFEELIHRLLIAMFPGEWERTQKTHDGSRDFVLRSGAFEYWAECKAYTPRLSMHVISPTLIMALLESVSKVLFFSKSAFNPRAQEIIAGYRSVVNKEIQVYDGLTLLTLVLRYPDIADEFFDGLEDIVSAHGILDWQVTIRRDVDLSHSEGYPEPAGGGLIGMTLFDVIAIDVRLKNNDPLQLARVSIHVDEISDNFQVLGKPDADPLIFDAEVEPAGIRLVRIYLKAIIPGEGVLLPRIRLSREGREFIQNGIRDRVKANISGLYQVPLVGEQFRAITKSIHELIGHRTRPLVLTAAGQSGVGKSRLLREILQIGLAHGYMVQHFESELTADTSAEFLIRQFLANANELPLFPDEPTAQTYAEKIQKHESLDRPEARAQRELLRILYDRNFSVHENHDIVLDALLQSILKKPAMLLIDNVQNRDDRFAQILSRFVSALEDISASFVLVLCFNEDLVVHGSNAAALLTSQKMRAQAVGSRFLYWEIREFSRQDAAEFLDLALAGSRLRQGGVADFQATLDLFLDHVQPRPLNLWQTLLYLTDLRVLRVVNEKIIVSDPKGLRTGLRTVPGELQKLLELRWRIVRRNAELSGLEAVRLEAAILRMYLLGSAGLQEIESFGVARHEVDLLVRTGFLTHNSAGRVEFFHFQIFLFFRGLNQSIPQGEAALIQRQFIYRRLSRPLFQQFLIVSHHAGHITPHWLSVCIGQFLKEGATREYGIEFCRILKEQLLAGRRFRLSRERLQALAQLASYIHHNVTFHEGVSTFEEVFCRLLGKWHLGTAWGREYFNFVHQMADALLGVHSDSRALEILSFAIGHIDDFTFESRRAKKLTLCRLLNRRSSTLKALGLYDQALEDSQTAIALAKDAGHPKLLMRSYFDCGNIFQRQPSERDKMLLYWQAGLSVYQSEHEAGRMPIDLHALHKKGVILLMQHRFEEAATVLRPGPAYAEVRENPFWGISILLLDVCRHLMASRGGEDHSEIRRKLIRVRDWWNVSGADRLGWAVFYMEAKFARRLVDFNGAVKSFCGALRMLNQQLDTTEVIARHSDVYRDIAIGLREMGASLSEADELSVPASLRDEIQGILQMGRSDFNDFCHKHIERALLATKDEAFLIV